MLTISHAVHDLLHSGITPDPENIQLRLMHGCLAAIIGHALINHTSHAIIISVDNLRQH